MPGPHKTAHENFYGEQGKHPRTFWVLQTKLLTPQPSSLHKPVMVPVDPTSILPPTYRLTSILYLETSGESCHILYATSCPSRLPGHHSSCGLLSLWSLFSDLLHLSLLVPLRIQGHSSTKCPVSSLSFLNVIVSSCSDCSLAVPWGHLCPHSTLTWWLFSNPQSSFHWAWMCSKTSLPFLDRSSPASFCPSRVESHSCHLSMTPTSPPVDIIYLFTSLPSYLGDFSSWPLLLSLTSLP